MARSFVLNREVRRSENDRAFPSIGLRSPSQPGGRGAAARVGDLELIQWRQERIGSLKKPSRVIITTEPLPINSAGKLLRRVARDRYGAMPG